MVRIINRQVELKPKPIIQREATLTENNKALLQILGIAIADNAPAMRQLLLLHKQDVPSNDTLNDLALAVIAALCKQNISFNTDLGEAILDCGLGDAYDSFDIKSLLHKSDDGPADSSSANSSGGGIIGGITNALGGIGNAIGMGRQAKDQATSKTLQGIYAYKAQLAANDQGKTKSKTNIMIGLFVLAGLAVVAFLIYQKKQKDEPSTPVAQTP